MKNALLVLLLTACAGSTMAAEPVPPVYRAPLPDLGPDQEVRMDVVVMPPGFTADVHTVMRNPGTTQTARFVAFTIKTAGAPPAVLVNGSTGNETR